MPDQVFTSGQVLTADQMSSLQSNIGLTFIKSQTVGAGVSTVEVTSCFSSTFDNYRIIYTGGTGTGASTGLRLGMTGSSTAYFNSLIYLPFTGGSVQGIANNNSLNYWQYAGTSDSNSNVFMQADIYEPFVSRSTRVAFQWLQTDASGYNGGIHKVNASYTGITIGVDSGTISGGTVYVYGYRK